MSNEAFSIRYDVAQGLDRGDRPYQEDCVAVDFAIGEPFGFGVLADGMGAHSAGDLASSVVVSSVFSFLKARKSTLSHDADGSATLLRQAAEIANKAVAETIETKPDARGMGATLLTCAIVDRDLFWVSIGDSPLYLFREGDLKRINQDHSMAPQIDAMVATGQISRSAAANHPERNVLTSAIVGQKLTKVDCPAGGTRLEDGDILILSSDGLQSLKDEEIQKLVRRHGQRGSESLVRALIDAVDERCMPDQDNVSTIVIRVDFGSSSRAVSSISGARTVDVETVPTDEIEEAPDFLKAVFS